MNRELTTRSLCYGVLIPIAVVAGCGKSERESVETNKSKLDLTSLDYSACADIGSHSISASSYGNDGPKTFIIKSRITDKLSTESGGSSCIISGEATVPAHHVFNITPRYSNRINGRVALENEQEFFFIRWTARTESSSMGITSYQVHGPIEDKEIELPAMFDFSSDTSLYERDACKIAGETRRVKFSVKIETSTAHLASSKFSEKGYLMGDLPDMLIAVLQCN